MSIRNIRSSVLVAAGIGTLAVAGLFAGRLFAHQMGEGFSRGRAGHVFDRIARRLDLSDSQQAQIRGILKSHAAEIESQVRAGIAARRALHQVVMAEPSDETEIRSRALEAGSVHADGAVLLAKIRSEIWPLLTDEQKGKLERFHDRRRMHREDSVESMTEFLRNGG